jgi:hypothetical protein
VNTAASIQEVMSISWGMDLAATPPAPIEPTL